MKLASSILALMTALFLASCGEQLSESDRVARNCQQADEGEKLFEKYRHNLVTAKDWETVGWIRQVPMSKALACRNQLQHHGPLDDCLDRLSYDKDKGRLPFQQAVDQCIALAKRKQARS